MKKIVLILALMSAYVANAATSPIMKKYGYACKSVEVVIDSIVRNDSISGHVVGLPTDAYDQFEMIFYVKTNRWYIHPYEYSSNQGEGYSFTYLNPDGSFKIKTILRDVPAKKLAAVLVPRTYKIRNQRLWLNGIFGFFGITRGSCQHTIVNGNGDFFL
jgi:hypothetical protein